MTRPFREPTLDDETIAALLREPKTLPSGWRTTVRPTRRQARHLRGELEIVGQRGNIFELHTRQHSEHSSNFSVILVYRTQSHSRVLLRCNGLHPGGHVNELEREELGTVFHVHRATQRYQEAGLDIDGFAEPDPHFTNIGQALLRMAELAGFVIGPEQAELF